MEYTILVADDEKEIRELLRLYLENSGYKVIEADCKSFEEFFETGW